MGRRVLAIGVERRLDYFVTSEGIFKSSASRVFYFLSGLTSARHSRPRAAARNTWEGNRDDGLEHVS